MSLLASFSLFFNWNNDQKSPRPREHEQGRPERSLLAWGLLESLLGLVGCIALSWPGVSWKGLLGLIGCIGLISGGVL